MGYFQSLANINSDLANNLEYMLFHPNGSICVTQIPSSGKGCSLAAAFALFPTLISWARLEYNSAAFSNVYSVALVP